jgi:N-acetylglucosamine kinase
MALAAVGEPWGMVVLAGTGSFVHARTPSGRRLHFGALGPLLGDYGSGYEIGLAALRAAFASHWTASRETSLASAVPPGLGVEDLNLVYIQGLDRRSIASLARVVDEQAEAGDRIAAAILRQAADDLFALVQDMLEETGLAGQEFPLVAAGSVAVKSRLWWERMCERVAEIAPGARPVTPRLMMVAGAALIALRRMGVAWTPEVLENLERTQNEFLQWMEQPAAFAPVGVAAAELPVSLEGGVVGGDLSPTPARGRADPP